MISIGCASSIKYNIVYLNCLHRVFELQYIYCYIYQKSIQEISFHKLSLIQRFYLQDGHLQAVEE